MHRTVTENDLRYPLYRDRPLSDFEFDAHGKIKIKDSSKHTLTAAEALKEVARLVGIHHDNFLPADVVSAAKECFHEKENPIRWRSVLEYGKPTVKGVYSIRGYDTSEIHGVLYVPESDEYIWRDIKLNPLVSFWALSMPLP